MTGLAPLRERLHADADLGREHLPADVAVALAGDFHRPLDRLAVADPRLVDADVQPEVAEQAVLDHFQVQLAHAADERLAGLLVFAGAEGGVLPLHHLQHVGQLLALGRASPARWPSRSPFRERRSIPAGSGSWTLHSVSPVIEWRRPTMPMMSPAEAESTWLRRSAWTRHSCGTFSFLSLPGFKTRLLAFNVPE